MQMVTAPLYNGEVQTAKTITLFTRESHVARVNNTSDCLARA